MDACIALSINLMIVHLQYINLNKFIQPLSASLWNSVSKQNQKNSF